MEKILKLVRTLLLVAGLCSAHLSAQTLSVNSHAYGTSANDVIGSPLFTSTSSVIKTADDNVVIVGTMGTKAFLKKIDTSGNVLFTTLIGGNSSTTFGTSIVQTSDSGYVISGYTLCGDGDFTGSGYHSGNYDAFLARFDVNGSLLWTKCYGASLDDKAIKLIKTSDGGFAFVGETNDTTNISGPAWSGALYPNYDFYVVKTDSTGNLVWQKRFGSKGVDIAFDMTQRSDGGYVLTGNTGSNTTNSGNMTGCHGGGDGWAVWIDSVGTFEQQQCYGSNLADATNGMFILPMAGNRYALLTDATNSNTGTFGSFTQYGMKNIIYCVIDNTGAVLNGRSFGSDSIDVASSFQMLSDSSMIIAGKTKAVNSQQFTGGHGLYDAFIMNVNKAFTLSWQRLIGGSGDDIGVSLIPYGDSVYFLVGNTWSQDYDIPPNQGTSINSLDIFLSRIELMPDHSLPVELTNFTAYVVNEKKVQCNWTTTSEINNDHFTIQRTVDGIHYEDLGKIAGAGNSNSYRNYVFYDDAPLYGVSYYRLKQTDFNGQSEIFNLVPVEIGSTATTFNVWQTNGELHCSPDAHIILITDILGNQIDNLTVPGIYFITLESSDTKITKHIKLLCR